MALNIMGIFLINFILLNGIFLSCFCSEYVSVKLFPTKQSVLSRAARAAKKVKPVTVAPTESHCYCETISKLCDFSPSVDIRIANDDEMTCSPQDYLLCDLLYGNHGKTCGVRKVKPSDSKRVGYELFGAHPWHVGIYNNDEKFIGSGVLITAQYVLTAAHKVAEPKLKFRFGEWTRNSDYACASTVERKALEITKYPSTDEKKPHEYIALVKLDKSIPLRDHPLINTACIASSVPPPGAKCLVAGWGVGKYGSNDYPDTLQEVEVPIVDSRICQETLRTTRMGRNYVLDTKNFICAGGQVGHDACTDDGGAPLMHETADGRFEVVGLVSWGINCNNAIPGVYINVTDYRNWINEQIVNNLC